MYFTQEKYFRFFSLFSYMQHGNRSSKRKVCRKNFCNSTFKLKVCSNDNDVYTSDENGNM